MNKQFFCARLALACFVFSLCSTALAADQPATDVTNPPIKTPQYPVPYGKPSEKQIKDVLDRVRDRLEAGTGHRLIDNKTKQDVADPSVPGAYTIDSGPEKKFSPYSYPMGVVYYGMLACAETTGDSKYSDFVNKRFEFLNSIYPKLKTWPKTEGRGAARNPLHSMISPSNLDACGAMGAAMIRAKRDKIGPDFSETIDRFADRVHNKQFRLDDGTLARKNPFPKSLWLDDAYMSVPLLVQMGKLTGDKAYFDDAAKQIKQFYAHLFVPSRGLFTHAKNMDNSDNQPSYCWGRANGWFAVATVECLDMLPQDHPDRAELIKILRSHAQGLASVQSGSGLWHQMLDRTDSYLETSCTAMFTYAMAKGVNRGWLDAGAYGPCAQAGWNGLTTKISSDGKVDGVCIGTNYADDYVYYYARPAVDDVHGYGPVLLAGSEMIKLVKNEKFNISDDPSRSVMYQTKSKPE